VCNPHETIARARAQMLHILYELGRAEHQFRFRFKGEYLRDGYTFEVSQQQLSQNPCFILFTMLFCGHFD